MANDDQTINLRPENRNGDYLKAPATTTAPAIRADMGYNQDIFEKSVADEMKAKYNSFNAVYEGREFYQLNTSEDYVRWEKSNKDLAEWTLRKLMQYHLEHTLKDNLEQGAKRLVEEPHSSNVMSSASSSSAAGSATSANAAGGSSAANAAKNPAGANAASATGSASSFSSASSEPQHSVSVVQTFDAVRKFIQNGSTVSMGETKTKFHYDFPSGMAQVGVAGPIINTNVDYHVRAVQPQAVIAGNPLSPSGAGEKLNLSASKSLDFLGASTGFNYGLMSANMNYNLSKRIVGPLSAQVSQSHNMRDQSHDETIYRVNFGTGF